MRAAKGGAGACHASDDLLSGKPGKQVATPLVPGLTEIRVTDSTVEEFDEEVMRTWLASIKGERLKRSRETLGPISTCR